MTWKHLSQRDGDAPASPAPGAHYDVVIIGSGFGGSTVAARLSQHTAERVAMFERGEERPPGAPRDPSENTPEVSRYGLRYGRLEVCVPTELPWPGKKERGFLVLRGVGVGGGSLVYLNARLRPQPEIFELKRGGRRLWPHALDLDVLTPYYDAADRAIPIESRAWPKTQLLRNIAADIDIDGHGPDVTQVDLAVKLTGADGDRRDCTAEGACWKGCPETGDGKLGSRRTLTENLLREAVEGGLELFAEHPILDVRRSESGYVVRYVGPDGETEGRVTAGRVVLAAGTMGTGEILLRSAEAGLDLPDRIGRSWSSNGDIAGLYYARPDIENAAGPTITTRLDFTRSFEGGDDWVGSRVQLEDLGTENIFPAGLCRILAALQPPAQEGPMAFEEPDIEEHEAAWTAHGDDWEEIVGRVAESMTEETVGPVSFGSGPDALYMLGMTLDDADGDIRFVKGRPVAFLNKKNNEAVIDHLREAALSLVPGLGVKKGECRGPLYRADPFNGKPAWGRDMGVTAHPLGGAVMGPSAAVATTDDRGRVHGHDGGLLVADGSLIPTSLGVNPALTISALAERVAWFLIRGGDDELTDSDLDAWVSPSTV